MCASVHENYGQKTLTRTVRGGQPKDDSFSNRKAKKYVPRQRGRVGTKIKKIFVFSLKTLGRPQRIMVLCEFGRKTF